MTSAQDGVTVFDDSQDKTALGRALEVLVLMGENLADVVLRLEKIYHEQNLTFVDTPQIVISFLPKNRGEIPDRGIKVTVNLYCDRECRVPILKVVRGPGLTCAEFQQVDDHMDPVKFWANCQWCNFKREDVPPLNGSWRCSKCQKINP